VKDGKADHITREPEQVKAFRDTWRDGIHSYLTYLRDRLTVARDLLTDSGSIFVQIGEENAHRVRAMLEEVFGEENFVSMIAFATTSAHSTNYLSNTSDYIIFFAKKKESLKFRALYGIKAVNSEKGDKYRSILFPNGSQKPLTKSEISGEVEIASDGRIFTLGDLVSKGWSEIGSAPVKFALQDYECPGNSHWKTHRTGLVRLGNSGRLEGTGKRLMFRRFIDDFGAFPFNNQWLDTSSGFSLSDPKLYVVQTRPLVTQLPQFTLVFGKD
jgi:adenine-specific DNA-methyltransferase